MIRHVSGKWAPQEDLTKHADIDGSKAKLELLTDGSESSHDLNGSSVKEALSESSGDHNDHGSEHGQTEVSQRPVSSHSDAQTENTDLVFDEKHDTESINPDLTIDTVLDGDVPRLPAFPSRRAASSGPFSSTEGLHSLDHSFAKTEDDVLSATGQNVLHVPKRRVDPFQAPARRNFSTESTSSTLGRLAASKLKDLSVEERIVMTQSSLKELQYVCSLPTSRERVTLRHVFDLIDKIRMRRVPHQWSLVDRRLKQVQSSAERVADFIGLVKDYGSDVGNVASLFYACCELSLQGKIFDSVALDGLLSIFHRVSMIVQHVKASIPDGVSSEQLYASLSKIIQVLQHICIDFIETLDELKKGGFRNSATFGYQINKHFEADIVSLALAANNAYQELWLISLRGIGDGSLEPSHGRILDWLNDHHNDKHAHGFAPGHIGSHGSHFVFDCVEPLIDKFFKSTSRILLVTGEAGYGEQELVSNLIERLQLALLVDAKLLHVSLGSFQSTGNSTIRFLKSLLRQLLDQSVGNTSFLVALNEVLQRSEHETVARTEDLLWELLADQCSKAKGNVAIVVDSVFVSDGASTSSKGLLSKLQELTSKSANVRCLALADPDAANVISGVQLYTISRNDIRRNARQFLQSAIAASATLSVLSAQIRQGLLKHIAERQWTSLLEAKLILRLLESESHFAHMPDIISKTPKTVQGMLDHTILKIDFKNPDMQTLLSWLLVGKRPIEVSELERHGSVTVSNWLRRIRSGRSVSSNSFLAGIITVQNGFVKFVDPLVKARMHHMSLHGKIPLSVHISHRQVAIDCLKHAHEHLQQKVDLVFQDPARSKWAATSKYSEFDALLVYSIRNWFDHYEKSLTSSEKLSRRVPVEVSSVLPDSVMMAMAEWHYLRAENADSGLDKTLSKVLALRTAVFGSHAPSVIQTLINLAHCEKQVRSSSLSIINVERLIEAFEGTVAAYGDPSPQATAGAKYILSILKSQTGLNISMPSRGFKVYRYLWSIYRRELGDSHDETLLVAQKLAELYKAEMKFADAAEVFQDMYEACCRTKGMFARQTIDLFHLLIDTLEHSDNVSDAQQLCQDIFDAAPSLETWNEAVLSAVSRIVRHYQDRGMSEVSKNKLLQLWTLLQGQFKKDASSYTDLLAAFTFVSLQLATKLRDLSQEREAASKLKAFWVIASKYVTTESRFDLSTLTQLRKVSQLLLRLEENEHALGILRVLYEIHQSPSHNHFGEVLQVYSALIACYKGVKNPVDDFLWLNILDSILLTASTHGSLGQDTVSLCLDLAILHRSRSQWTTTIDICLKSLSVLWPQAVSDDDQDEIFLPEQNAQECIQMTIIVAQMYKLTDDAAHAEHLLQSIVQCCTKHILRWLPSGQDIANTLSLALEEAELQHEALHFWKSILDDCNSHLGRGDQFTLQVASAIARLSLELDIAIDFDDAICKVLEIEPDEDDFECISMLIEGMLALCRTIGKQERGPGLLKWYDRLWSYYFDLRHDLAMDTDRGFEIFQGYSAVLIGMKNVSGAIRLARKLRATFLSDFGLQDIWYLKASLELTKLLELDDATLREAVDIYDEIYEISLALSSNDEAFMSILLIAQERLSLLVSSKPILHDRAEQILVKAWEKAYKKYGHAHERSISCLQKLLAFWASVLNVEHKQKAMDSLKEAVQGTINKEKNPRKLFQLAQSFVSMYRIFGADYSDLGFLSSIRWQISKSASQQKGLCGTAYRYQEYESSSSYDRRCLVLVYSMQELFKSKTRDGLLADILTRVMTETALYEAWLRARLNGSHLDDQLSSGVRLIEHLDASKLNSESQEIEEELWALFCQSLGQNDSKRGSTRQFFQTILAASREEEISQSLLETSLLVIQELANAANRKAGLQLSQWIYSYVQTRAGLEDSTVALLCLKLSTILYSCSEAESIIELSRSIEELATKIGVLAVGNTSDIDLSVMSTSHLAFLLNVAGRQKDYKTLKQILEVLWTSRNNYDFNLTPTTTISIGKRLAEVHFACGEHAAAFELLEDISYNLKDVYGVNHPLTLDCQKLLASMHESLGHRKNAIDVRLCMLKDALTGRDEYDLDEVHTGSQLDTSIQFYLDELRVLRHEYAATDEDYAWHLEQNFESLEEVINQVKKLLGDSNTLHDAGDILGLDSWKALEPASDEAVATWSAPADWSIEMEVEEDAEDNTWPPVEVESVA